MSSGWASSLLALAVAAPGAASAAGRIAIDHAPLECVPYERYTRITASGAPAAAVASAQLEFRTAVSDESWYSVGMVAQGTEWSAFLPRPVPPLARLEYRIVMRSPEAGEEATPTIVARVEAECGSAVRSAPAVDAPIVVRRPRGAPLVPPVPSGFSPAGVVAAREDVRTPGVKELAIGAGLAAGITAAFVLGTGAASAPRELSELPVVAFSGTIPASGGVLSLGEDELSVLLHITGRGTTTIQFFWIFELLGVGGDTVCVSTNGRLVPITSLPATVTLTAPLLPRPACGARFDVDRARLRVSIEGRTVFDEILAPLPFHFEP
jgi:hypothetical protein